MKPLCLNIPDRRRRVTGQNAPVVDELFEESAAGAFTLRVQVQPGAGRSAVVGRHGNALKLKVAAPPEKGRANAACAVLIAEILGLKPADIELASGESSRSKRFRISGLERDDLADRLGRALEDAPLGGGNARSRRDVPGSPRL